MAAPENSPPTSSTTERTALSKAQRRFIGQRLAPIPSVTHLENNPQGRPGSPWAFAAPFGTRQKAQDPLNVGPRPLNRVQPHINSPPHPSKDQRQKRSLLHVLRVFPQPSPELDLAKMRQRIPGLVSVHREKLGLSTRLFVVKIAIKRPLYSPRNTSRRLARQGQRKMPLHFHFNE